MLRGSCLSTHTIRISKRTCKLLLAQLIVRTLISLIYPSPLVLFPYRKSVGSGHVGPDLFVDCPT